MQLLRKAAASFGMTRFLSLLVLIAMLLLRYENPTFVGTLRNQSFDLFQRIHPRQYTRLPVAIIDIDEAAIEKYGQWPWPRTRLAELVEKLAAMGSVATAFDIVFSEEDRLSPALVAVDNAALDETIKAALIALPSNDNIFADAMKKSRIVVGQTSVRSISDTGTKLDKLRDAKHAVLGPDPRPFMFNFPDIVQNIASIEEAASGRGIFTVKPDDDGIFRRVPLVMKIRGKLRLSLSAELLRVATGGRAFAVRTDVAGIRGVVLAGKLVRTARSGNVWPYFSESTRARFVSAGSILDGSVHPKRLAGHLLLVGTSAVGLEDYRATPMGVLMPGVEIHAQVIENIMANQLLFRPHYAISVELTTIAALGLGAIILVPLLGAIWSFITASMLLVGYVGGSYFAFTEYRLLIDPTFPVYSTVLVFILLATANYLREEQKRKQIRGAFSQYISPALVDQLADEPDMLKLGGETRELTLLFSDVRGFTPISESYKDNPQGLTVLMNLFLTVLSEAILKYSGTIDKFMGDAVMAFWNAPLKAENHAEDGCRSALLMLGDVADLNKTMLAEHNAILDAGEEPPVPYHAINIGIGLNSGPCVVGNMGSEMRFDYTALGDTVNIAARLEGQSKQYGVKIVLGNNTAKAVADKFALFEIDLIRVKGKQEPLRIFGLFGDEELAGNADFITMKNINNEMLINYRAQKLAAASKNLKAMETLNEITKLDFAGYLELYHERIADSKISPPEKDWDGVYTATTK